MRKAHDGFPIATYHVSVTPEQVCAVAVTNKAADGFDVTLSAIAPLVRLRAADVTALQSSVQCRHAGKKTATECGCQPVAFIIASIVAPVGDCSKAMTRDCFEPPSD